MGGGSSRPASPLRLEAGQEVDVCVDGVWHAGVVDAAPAGAGARVRLPPDRLVDAAPDELAELGRHTSASPTRPRRGGALSRLLGRDDPAAAPRGRRLRRGDAVLLLDPLAQVWREARVVAAGRGRLRVRNAGWPPDMDVQLRLPADAGRVARPGELTPAERAAGTPSSALRSPSSGDSSEDSSGSDGEDDDEPPRPTALNLELDEPEHRTADDRPPPPCVWTPRAGEPVDARVFEEGEDEDGEEWLRLRVQSVRADAVEVASPDEAEQTLWLPREDVAAPGSRTGEFAHAHCGGDFVDVKDYYRSKRTGKQLTQWRAAVVLRASRESVDVHYHGWDASWDERINVVECPHRVRPLGAMTIPESAEEAAARATEQRFAEALERAGLEVLECEPDGNCLFRAVATQVYGDAELHRQVRQECCDHLLAHRERLGGFHEGSFDAHVAEMRRAGVWGDDLEIRALEEVFDRAIVIFDAAAASAQPMNVAALEDGPVGIEPIRLSYHGRSHYNAVLAEHVEFPLPRRRTGELLKRRTD